MKRFLLISFLVLIPFLGINAQENNPNRKGRCSEMMIKYMETKKQYLKQCIPLSDSDAEKFFVIYNELEKAKFNIMFAIHKEAREIKKSTEPISDEVYAEVANKLAELPSKIAAIESEYYEKLKQILTPKQMFMFFNCEYNFGKQMLKREQNQNK